MWYLGWMTAGIKEIVWFQSTSLKESKCSFGMEILIFSTCVMCQRSASAVVSSIVWFVSKVIWRWEGSTAETSTVTFEARRRARRHGYISFCVNAPSSSRGENITKMCVLDGTAQHWKEQRSEVTERGAQSKLQQDLQMEMKTCAET